jgi:signal transduction histidine kinase
MEPIDIYYCSESTPTLAHFFTFGYAPTLLFYAYIPIILVSLFLGFFVFFKDRYSLQSKLLLILSSSFVLWILNIILQWIAVYARIVHFSAQITAVFEIPIFIFAIYFVDVFLNKKDISLSLKIFLSTIAAVVIVLLPTQINTLSFDLINCQSNVGILWKYIYVGEILSIFYVIYLCLRKYFSSTTDKIFKKQIIYLMSGVVLFLSIFSASDIFGELTQVYAINLFGPIGMVIFLGLLSYMIVRFKAFNIKLLATEALVWGLGILIGSQFFFIRTPINRVLNGFTFIAAVIFGHFLVKSVKVEVQQKEELAKLNVDLKNLIKQRESLVHLVTHKVKGSFTRTKALFAGIADGTFGDISPEIKRRANQGLEFDNNGIQTVDLVLNAANMQNGTVRYDMKNINFKDLVEKIISEKEIQVEERKLKLEKEFKDGNYNVMADTIWIKEVINNLVDNAIKYTLEGTVTVGLENRDSNVLLYVKDTGIGITEEDKKSLFTEGGRGKDSVKVNVDSTGYGLYTVKLITEAHKGKVWVESTPGKGSTFFVELPKA